MSLQTEFPCPLICRNPQMTARQSIWWDGDAKCQSSRDHWPLDLPVRIAPSSDRNLLLSHDWRAGKTPTRELGRDPRRPWLHASSLQLSRSQSEVKHLRSMKTLTDEDGREFT